MNNADSVISAAKGWLGTTEYSPQHEEIISYYNKARYADAYKMKLNDPWCAAFVVACFAKSDCADLIPCYASTDQMISLFKKWNRFYYRPAYSPVKGDIIFYNWDGDAVSDHVGIVVANQFGELSVIEGNKSDTVGYRNISQNSANIIGIGRPNYDGEVVDSGIESTVEDHPFERLSYSDQRAVKSFPMLYKSSRGIHVKILQLLLQWYGNFDLEIDGDFGELTDKAVREWQTAERLEVDGYVGKETWASFFTK